MKIITISRQYGAGGREIGLAVGKELGVTLYDRDIIAATAKASSIDASQIEREGEEISATESILRNITPISYDQKDYIYETQRSVILDLAKQGPCVILGRCADVVLHDAGIETLNVYIYSCLLYTSITKWLGGDAYSKNVFGTIIETDSGN